MLILAIVFPLIYHDISEEIPEASRPLITRLYLLWLVLAGTLVVNMVACIFVLTSGGSDGVKDLIVSIMCVLALDCDLLVNSRLFACFGQHCPADQCSVIPTVVQVRGCAFISYHRVNYDPHDLRPIYNGYMKVRFTLPSQSTDPTECR